MKVSIAGIAVKDSLIFIARRCSGGAMDGKWEFPGGKADEGEGREEALIRELWEEFGITVRVGKLLGESSFVHNEVRRELFAYQFFFPLDAPLKLTEHSEFRWADLKEIKQLDFTPSDLTLLPFIEPLVS
ncbi:MAG: NUDIX domain-containing protein [Spirochaetaceae bacterium]|jgi:8-oxo-dGTP diphosphatase|nr:NUDIX domain-containing protein [Spirochaetaceae bacterium]